MPEYELLKEKVKVTVIGKVLDLDFARVLARNPRLSLAQIIALDKVQKRKSLTDVEIRKISPEKYREVPLGKIAGYFNRKSEEK